MKTPKEYAHVAFRAGALEETLAARSSEQSNSGYSQVAKEDLRDYYALLRLSPPRFTADEQAILFQTLNGWLATPETVHLLWAEVAECTDDQEFIARLRRLSRFECWSLIDAVQHGGLS